ncbi:MAG: methyltransferase [Gammaproteobacteria bacterium]|nr:methyltransferase [Gammaproteobacteria bacterium]
MKILQYLAVSLLTVCTSTGTAAESTADLLDRALAGDHRSTDNRARDQYRHPKETLQFFGLEPDMTVVEITPGGGWYTEVLAPVLKERGRLIVAGFGSDHPVEYLANIHVRYIEKLDADPGTYGEVRRIVFQAPGYLQELEDESADMMLTFRNTHNWIKFGTAEDIYRDMYRVLKSCGTLGVVQHRAEADADPGTAAKQGYVPEPYLIDMIESIGFRLIDRSEINANPHDTKDHPEGVWTLPPTYRMGDQDREQYAAIGESDRMTLRFAKPMHLADGNCPAQ